MGTLDDAIREHLELKRRLGASEEELERKEAEALGGRSPAPEPPAAETQPAAQEPAPAAPEPVVEPEFLDEPDLAAVDPESARNGSSATAPESAPSEPAEPEPARDGADLFDQDLIERSTAPPEGPVVRRARPAPEPEPEPDSGEEPAEDFLEDTPDFLEETPEHDRLWFEQKPPKDFDFD
jgi:hypothetical protein